TAAARRDAVPRGTGRSRATSPTASSRTRSRPWARPRRSSPTWTRAGSASVAGRLAGTCRRSRCCAARPGSTPGSRGRPPAPAPDWGLYDTHYTERYLGDPNEQPDVYQRSSIVNDPQRAVLTQIRPLLVIHGLADDNVFVAHSLRMSSALLAAGYPHSVLPL